MDKIKLNNQIYMDKLGLGVFMINDRNLCSQTVSTAINMGYKMIDTANIYFNEVATGEGIKASEVNRKDLFIVSKIWPQDFKSSKTAKAINDTLNRLQIDYIDLLLLHRPYGPYLEAWSVLESFVDAGKIKSIGVSNFNQKQLKKLLEHAKIKPVVNQVECHPYYQQTKLKAFMNEEDIVFEAWYPLGHGSKILFSEPIFETLSNKYQKSIVQIILRWHIQNNHIIIPKSTNPKHLFDNINIFDFNLTDEEMLEINKLDKNTPLFKVPDFIQKLQLLFIKHDFNKQ